MSKELAQPDASSRPHVLIIIGHYTPSFRAGGPVRSIENLVAALGDEFRFSIITRDRDHGDTQPFAGVETGRWTERAGVQIFYTRPDQRRAAHLRQLINEAAPDLVYANSLFDWRLNLRAALVADNSPASPGRLLAPRGELDRGALRIKSAKKRLFLAALRHLRSMRGLAFHATSEAEVGAIKQQFPGSKVGLAPNIPSLPVSQGSPPEHDQRLRLCFVSRISPKKNLDGAIKALRHISTPTVFDIYGPKEDESYWRHCEALTAQLPDYVEWRYRGTVRPDDVGATFSRYDGFLFLTHGENYGHVIAEALQSGTACLLSDQTPWRGLAADQCGMDVDLGQGDVAIARHIEQWAQIGVTALRERRAAIREVAARRVGREQAIEAMRALFRAQIGR